MRLQFSIKTISNIFLSTLVVLLLLLGHHANAQSDSTEQFRVGFASLFKVTSTGEQNKPFQFQLNPKGVSFIESYMEKQGPSLLKMKNWARPYFNLYDQILIKNGIPVELKYLSVIESSLVSNLVSWAGAAGPWQIMPEEAKRLGLKLLPVDERTDYYKSTQAACTILKELYAEFGDWLLVVAAYNGGAGRMRQVIKKKGSNDFWQIQYELPLETRNHVKKFIATHYVFEEDAKWASGSVNTQTQPEQGKSASSLYKQSVISGRYKLAVIATAIKIPENQLLQLNPAMEKILSQGKTYNLTLPADRLEIFEAHKKEILQASIKALYEIKN
jgi:membrane-bound lytic murein transglycosylase D